MKIWKCAMRDYIYDPTVGDPANGIPPRTNFEDIPDTWTCPECGVLKEDFELI